MICNKNIYTKKDAELILKNINKKRQYRKEKRAYFCDKCNGWHLTSSEEFLPKVSNIELVAKSKWKKLIKNNVNI